MDSEYRELHRQRSRLLNRVDSAETAATTMGVVNNVMELVSWTIGLVPLGRGLSFGGKMLAKIAADSPSWASGVGNEGAQSRLIQAQSELTEFDLSYNNLENADFNTLVNISNEHPNQSYRKLARERVEVEVRRFADAAVIHMEREIAERDHSETFDYVEPRIFERDPIIRDFEPVFEPPEPVFREPSGGMWA